MNIRIFESTVNCGETFIFEGQCSNTLTLECDECERRHAFVGREMSSFEYTMYQNSIEMD